jgi:pantoate--beta-alanine ligase
VEVTGSPSNLRETCDRARADGLVVGLVPTMGALHQGHGRLIKQARGECGFVVLSIFVNPLQFSSDDDLAGYPRSIEKDTAVASALGCDLLFAPREDAIYPSGAPEVTVDPGPLGERLEGRSRPGHFRGVLTVVAKLFELAGQCHAYFGEKDAQQLALVRRMVRDLDMPVEVVGCPAVREIDGLALSSRNALLPLAERRAAPVLFEALSGAASLVRKGERSGDVLRAGMARRIGSERLARLDYVSLVDEETWADVDTIQGPVRALVAASFGPVRLIDNIAMLWSAPPNVQNTDDS